VAKQKQFDGDGFPERLPKAVEEARDQFIGAKRRAANAAGKRSECEILLIESMESAGVDRVKLDGENKFIEIERKPHASIKTIPKDQQEKADKR